MDLANTDHDTCKFVVIDDANLKVSKSTGYDQCPQGNLYGLSCPEYCDSI